MDDHKLLSFLAKINVLIKNRLDKNGFTPEKNELGLVITTSSTALPLHQYRLLHLANTEFQELVSLDWCHGVFVDYGALEILRYCEGNIEVQTASNFNQLSIAITHMIDWARQQAGQPIIHETALAEAFKALENAKK